MQTKDIPTAEILFFLTMRAGETCTHFGTDATSDGTMPENSVARAMPPGTAPKLVLSKMKKLVKQNLVNGCGCGCRGDFMIAQAGCDAVKLIPEEDQVLFKIKHTVVDLG